VVRDEVEAFSVESEHQAEETVAQLDRATDNGVEYWLDIGRGTADHPQDLARRRLLLVRLRKLSVARLEDFCGGGLLFLRVRQAPVELATPGGFVLQRLPDGR
jgi:hypothetical protein